MNNLPLVGGGNKPFYTGLNFVVKTLETGQTGCQITDWMPLFSLSALTRLSNRRLPGSNFNVSANTIE